MDSCCKTRATRTHSPSSFEFFDLRELRIRGERRKNGARMDLTARGEGLGPVKEVNAAAAPLASCRMNPLILLSL
jgi:hypothetical protein